MAWLRRRLWEPLVSVLRQGASPEGLAWSLSTGLALGICPLWGTSTALCAAAGAVFRLNQVALQLANYLAYPLQLALLIPFIRLGERLFGSSRLPLSLGQLQQAIRSDAWGALGSFWTSLWHASVAWLLVVPLPMVLLVWALTPAFRGLAGRFQRP